MLVLLTPTDPPLPSQLCLCLLNPLLSVLLITNKGALSQPAPPTPTGAPGSPLTAPGLRVTSHPPAVPPHQVLWLGSSSSVLVSQAQGRSGFQIPSLPLTRKVGRSLSKRNLVRSTVLLKRGTEGKAEGKWTIQVRDAILFGCRAPRGWDA